MPAKPVKHPDSETARRRREQIVEAAVAVIAAQGLPNLSLSEIEKQAGMSRGQLTYYFPAKEDILLAVFDRLLQLMVQRIGTPQGQPCEQASGWDWVRHLLQAVPEQPHDSPGFHTLQYTFLAQMGHREDFRQRLATLYEEWRGNMGRGLAQDLERRPPVRPVDPRALATLIQALLHGLAMQRAADPQSFDHGQLLHLCVDLLGTYLWGDAADGKKSAAPTTNKRKRPARAAARGLQGAHP